MLDRSLEDGAWMALRGRRCTSPVAEQQGKLTVRRLRLREKPFGDSEKGIRGVVLNRAVEPIALTVED